ncbi:MAG: ribonuclease, partial [Deltaproteobacteria bacterium]
MARKILINASEPEEVRVAVVKEGVLVDFFVELPFHRSILGNIYKGRVTHVEGGLQAAFVDFGEKREGFLPFREI